jgi:pilus assembly protein CpaB
MRLAVIISLGTSALLGTAALLVARVWLAPAGKPGAASGHAAAVQTAPVVLASAALAYGDPLDATKLVVVRYPVDLVPQGAFSTIAQLVAGSSGPPVALAPIAAREPILPAKISGAGARKSISVLIAPGMRAYAIRVSDVAGVGGHVLPGDRVDVVLTRQSAQAPGAGAAPSAGAGLSSDVIVQDVRVLGINLNADPASTTAAATADPRTATLEVSLGDAQKLAVASGVGSLSLALRRTGAGELAQVRPVLVNDLSSAGPRAPARPASPRRSAPSVAASVTTSSVLIVQGDHSSSVSVPVESLGGI